MVHFGSQNPSKIDPKFNRFFDWFFDAILIPKWIQNDAQRPPKIIQKTTKILTQFSSNFRCDFGSILVPFLSTLTIDLAGRCSRFMGSGLFAKDQEKHKKRLPKFMKIHQFWHENASQNRSKSRCILNSEKYRKIMPNEVPKWLLNRSKSDPKNVQKTRPKNHRKILRIVKSTLFSVLFRDWFFQGAKGLPGTQNDRFWLPKLMNFGTQNLDFLQKSFENPAQNDSKLCPKWS